MLRVASNHCDEGEGKDHGDEEHLAQRHPEFNLTKPIDSQDIQNPSQVNVSQRS
jgi:hypothetical protein